MPAPCQPEDVMLKWFDVQKGGIENYAFLHPCPHPNSANSDKLQAAEFVCLLGALGNSTRANWDDFKIRQK